MVESYLACGGPDLIHGIVKQNFDRFRYIKKEILLALIKILKVKVTIKLYKSYEDRVF